MNHSTEQYSLDLESAFSTIETSHVSISDILKAADVDTDQIDYAVPQAFCDERLSAGDQSHYVWDYREESTFGKPLRVMDLQPKIIEKALIVASELHQAHDAATLSRLNALTRCLSKEQVATVLTAVSPIARKAMVQRFSSALA